jgi:hypothetical protein
MSDTTYSYEPRVGDNVDSLKVEDARIIWRNFSGVEKQYNEAGHRNFNLVVTDKDLAEQMIHDGWNLKPRKNLPDDADPEWVMKVNVRFDFRPPDITMITSRSKVKLNENTVGTLDQADIRTLDLVIRPYVYDKDSKPGISAYLDVAYATIEEDPFARKYSDYPSEDDGPLPF